ncbi:MAG: hypothetical protein ACJAUA_000869 [Zhongshania aliphaticivorans]|jgi:hypothetical protein
MSLKNKLLDVKLINKLAQEENQLSQDLSISDTNEPSLSDSLSIYREHFEKKRLKAAGSYLELQQIFAYLLFGLVGAWLVAVTVTIFLSGFGYRNFHLSDSVLIAFITSTTTSVIGLFLLVARWLFGSK